jgi:hypothetical protein
VADRWDELSAKIAGLEAERLERARRERDEARQRHDHDVWARAALERLMGRLKTLADERADRIAEQSGRRAKVASPTWVEHGTATRRVFLRVTLDDAEVHIYGNLTGGAMPSVHLMHLVAQSPVGERTRLARRYLSVPGCRMRRADDDGYELVRYEDEAGPLVITADDLIFKAFDLLVLSLRSMVFRVVRGGDEAAAAAASARRKFAATVRWGSPSRTRPVLRGAGADAADPEDERDEGDPR